MVSRTSLLVLATAMTLFSAVTATSNFANGVVDTWTYEQGTGVTVDDAYDPDPADGVDDAKVIWHDATTSPLKLKLKIKETDTTADTNFIATAANFLTITGESPKTIAVNTGFSIGTPKVTAGTGAEAGSSWIEITVTFDATAPAGTTYKIRYDCANVRSSLSATATKGKTDDCTYSPAAPLYVRIGWVPQITIEEIVDTTTFLDVTKNWIDLGTDPDPELTDPALLVKHRVKIEVTPGNTLRTVKDLTLGGDVYWPSASGAADMNKLSYLFASTDTTTDGDAHDAVYTAPVTGTAFTGTAAGTVIAFDPASLTGDDSKKKFITVDFAPVETHKPGTYVVRLASGALLRDDYARSAQTVFYVYAGFRVTANFIETDDYDTEDSWFPADKKLALKVSQPAEDDFTETGFYLSSSNPAVTVYGRGTGQLLQGMTALPGNINGLANTNTGANLTFYQYPLVTAGVSPNKYDFEIAQGVLVSKKTNSLSVRNAKTKATLKIGFKPVITIVEGTAPVKATDADERKTVTDFWLNLDKDADGNITLPHALVIRPPTNTLFKDANIDTYAGPDDLFNISDTENSALVDIIKFKTTFAERSTSGAPDVMIKSNYIEIPFDAVEIYAPGKYELEIDSGVLTLQGTAGIESCKVTIPIRAGFAPTLSFIDHSTKDEIEPRADKWFLPTETIDLYVTTEATGITINTNTSKFPKYGIGKGELLHGMPSLPGSKPSSVGSGIKSSTTDTYENEIFYTLDMSTIEPGTYTFTISNGVLVDDTDEVNPIYNYAADVDLLLGFELDWEIWDMDKNDTYLQYDSEDDTNGFRYYIANPRKVAWKGMSGVPVLNPNNNHKIIFTPGSYNNAPRSFSADTVSAPPALDKLFLSDGTDPESQISAADDFLGPSKKLDADEGRISYDLAAKAGQAVGTYSVFVDQELFRREFTDAANVVQEIAINVGFGILVDFSTSEDWTAASDDLEATPPVTFNRWFSKDDVIFMYIRNDDDTLEFPVADTDLPAPTWSKMFSINPGKCASTDGIAYDDEEDIVENAAAYGYKLKGVDAMKPGQYHFEVPASVIKIVVDTDQDNVLTYYNYYARNYLKIGFPSKVDFITTTGKSLMDPDSETVASEPLSPNRKLWQVRASILTDTYDQTIEMFNTVASLDTAIEATVAFTVDDDNDPDVEFEGTAPTLDDITHDVTSTPAYTAMFPFSTGIAAGDFFYYSVKDGVFCTNAAKNFEADVVNKICNAVTASDDIAQLIVGYDVTITIENEDEGAYTDASDDDEDFFSNVFDADFTKVYELPIFAGKFTITLTYPDATIADSDMVWEDMTTYPNTLALPTLTTTDDGEAAVFEYDVQELTPGTYDIEVLPNFKTVAITDKNTVGNARARFRLVIGPKPMFYKLDLIHELVPRQPSGAFSIGINSVYLALGGIDATAFDEEENPVFKLSDVLMVKNAAGAIVTSAVTIDDTLATIEGASLEDVASTAQVEDQTINKNAPAFRLGLDGLSDGTYTFIIGGDLSDKDDEMTDYNSAAYEVTTGKFKDSTDTAYNADSFKTGLKVTVIIDRTPPVPKAVTYTEKVIYMGLPSGDIPLSPELFSDAGTPDNYLAVTVTSADPKGLELRPDTHAVLASAYLTTSATAVRRPPGNAVFVVTATDEAGNSADAVFTVPVIARASGVLTVSDKRAVQSITTLYTGSTGSLTSDALPLKLVVDFNAPVTNVDLNGKNLVCTVDCSTCVISGLKVTAFPGGKRFTYDFIVNKNQIKADANITLKLDMAPIVANSPKKVVTATGSYDVEAPKPVFVVIDKVAPTPVTYLAPYRATVGVRYSITLPSKLYYDNLSGDKKIRLVSASPANQFGLAFTADFQGNATISGIPSAVPPVGNDNRVVFTITGQDEAGNNGLAVSVVIAINPAPAVAPTFTVKGTLLTFTETDNDDADSKVLSFDADAVFTAGSSTARFYGVKAYLIRPENDEEVDDVPDNNRAELLTASQASDIVEDADNCPADADDCNFAYEMDPLTGEGSIGIYYAITQESGGAVIEDDDGNEILFPMLTGAMIQKWVRSLKYKNTRKDVTGGNRVIRVDVWSENTIMVGQRIDALGNTIKGTVVKGNGVVATATRTVKAVAVNNVPTVSVDQLSEWDESDADNVADGIAVFQDNVDSAAKPVLIADTDDNDFTGAYLTISLTSGTVKYGDTDADEYKYGACDKARDKLVLDVDYLNTDENVQGVSPKAIASWSPISCTLTIIPAPPLLRVTAADMEAAVTAVRYVNLDPRNPVNYAGDKEDEDNTYLYYRYITVYVEDAANQGKVADKKRNLLINDYEADDKVFTTNILEILVQDDKAEVDRRAIFGSDGILSSTNKFANMERTFDDDGSIKIKAFPLVLPADYDNDGEDVEYQGSGLVYTIEFDLTQVKDANGNPIPGKFAKGQIYDVDTATPPAADKITIRAIDSAGDPVDLADIPDNTADSWDEVFAASHTDPDTSVVTNMEFTYSETGNSVLTIVLLDNTPVEQLGSYKFRLDFGEDCTLDDCAVEFYIDVRRKACLDDVAGRANTDDSTTETYILTRNTDLTEADLPKFFPENALCAYEPTEISASSGKDYDVSRGGYTRQKDSLDKALAALLSTGADIQSQIAALKELRNAARGAFSINIPAGSLASRGSMELESNKASGEAIKLLPQVSDSKEVVDTDVAIKLQPAGTIFSIPVKICLFSGDAPEGTYKVMGMAQQKDPGDPSKGYLPWEKLFDQSYNPATGEVCGFTRHFSVFAPITRPLVTSVTVPKAHLMGGSCPNQCSGHGTCRQEGQCACFAGFEGYDCSMRVCPSAESWGQDQEVMHTQSECSGRGVCQREIGTCACYDGYEGAACERTTCPNDCSGHGKCRLMSELPKVQQAGYNSWELKRLSKCICDGGYTGGDCSLRLCPFGDDPETVCSYTGRQVQRLTLDFVTDPTGTGTPNVDIANDQFALIFTTAQGKNYTTPMIDDIWDGTAASVKNIANALRTLPEFAVIDVKVSSTPTTSQSLVVNYDVTFSGSTNTGNEILMSCPFNSLGSTGCPAPGCRPKFTQLRIFQTPVMPQAVQISPLTVLQQPKPLGTGVGDKSESTPNVFGVETTLVINKYNILGSSGTTYTYKFVNTKVYDQSVDVSGKNFAEVVEETPIPPSALRTGVPGPYGLLVDFGSDTQLDIDYSGQGPFTYTFAWRLPKCSISILKAADKDLERAECSNRGLCDRGTGECQCFRGYNGYSCSQQTVYT